MTNCKDGRPAATNSGTDQARPSPSIVPDRTAQDRSPPDHKEQGQQASTRHRRTPLKTTPASEIEPEQVRWLWRGYIPRGKLTILEGRPGLGKTSVALDIIARVTRGLPMPDGTLSDAGHSGVVLVSTEDGAGDTLVPRLAVARAALEQVHILDADQVFELSREGLERLKATIAKHSIGLVVLDPLSAMLGNLDSHKDAEVRRALAPVTSAAAESDCAIIGIRHHKKGSGHAAIDAGSGSTAFGATARSVLVVAPSPGGAAHDPKRYLASVKGNLATPPATLGFELVQADGPSGPAPSVRWGAPSSLSAEDLMGQPSRGPTRLDEAKDVLLEVLRDGPLPGLELRKRVEGAGLSWPTARRAAKAMGMAPNKTQGRHGHWEWTLPLRAPEGDQDAGATKVITLSTFPSESPEGDQGDQDDHTPRPGPDDQVRSPQERKAQ
jgi:putative DNA primase/helicase